MPKTISDKIRKKFYINIMNGKKTYLRMIINTSYGKILSQEYKDIDIISMYPNIELYNYADTDGITIITDIANKKEG